MPESPAATSAVADFIRRWEASGAAERANYQLFLSELCDLLGVPRPEPTRPDDRENGYVFERNVCFRHGDGSSSIGRIDLYRRGHFVCEAKQGSDQPGERSPLAVREEGARWPAARRGTAVRGTRGWDLAMLRAKGQAEQYARALPVEEGWPPFLVVVDVGHAIELYSDFSCAGKAYLPFPDPRSHRILLSDLDDDGIRQRLRLVWSDPHTLDPARQSARVTRQVADRLAILAKSLERGGHSAEEVGNFLKRCLFTMFAEDIGLIPLKGFTELLESLRGQADAFAPMAESLWATMKDGGFSPVLRQKLLRFNGGLFEEARALPIGEEQLELLIDAGRADWREVEPAIFGTLLERALAPEERHHLGAHYTPREYVERLVLPTVVEPLRADWEVALAAAVTLERQGDGEGAMETVRGFHRRLCQVRILDPACGSGNFLYVTFEQLKRLEGEVLNALEGFGDEQADLELAGLTVDPHQLLGLEVNPRAAAITDMVLWIGYLQWHFRTRGQVMPPEPVIRRFRNVECRDAVLAYDAAEPLLDADGNPVTRWDGRTTRPHPVTGEQVPDEAAQIPLLRYLNPRRAEWPEADFVVGNPPFLGAGTMRRSLGDGYAEALRAAWKDVPDSADFVMFWWQRAAELTRTGRLRRFGFITTNSLRQTFNRRVLQQHLTGKPALSLAFAIPDHPWVDSADGAAVRIAMTVGRPATEGTLGTLATVIAEREGNGEGITVDLATRRGVLHPDLTAGANVAGAEALRANENISCPGVKLHGSGFIVTPDEAEKLGLGRVAGLEQHIRPYRNGRDLTASPRGVLVIDLFGLDADKVRDRFPEVYQWLLERVKPERDAKGHSKDGAGYAKLWWLFGKPRQELRKALSGLPRYVATVETAKHRTFQFLDAAILPDNKLICIASDDAYTLGVLSSKTHVTWSLAAGGWLGVGNDPVYAKSRCFETFPFPDTGDDRKQAIRDLAERLDAHRKRQQELHPGLGLTDMYNVLEKLRTGEALSTREKAIHEKGLVSVLRQLHDELDAAVAGAYGWPVDLPDEETLERLVALNSERAREEARGVVRWLRPEYQAPHEKRPAVQAGLRLAEEETTSPAAIPTTKAPWPKTLPEQVQAVRAVLTAASGPLTAEAVARTFLRARADKVGELLATLATLGQAREVEPGSYAC
jgi:hypothetical protein